jgi:hypothetical protein
LNILCGIGIINTLNFDQAGVGVCVALAALIAQMAAPTKDLHQFLSF